MCLVADYFQGCYWGLCWEEGLEEVTAEDSGVETLGEGEETSGEETEDFFEDHV
jgi:hypothetical protein